jgi:glycosyltransferase involved in cell wall biosynthesis
LRKILLINWDNYPNTAVGGIYSWAKDLIEAMHKDEFTVLNWISNPDTNGKFKVPNNVKKVIDIPLYGAFRQEEFSDNDSSLLMKIKNTTHSVIQSNFIPLFLDLVHGLLANSYDHNKVQSTILNIHKFMITHDYKKCVEYPKCWDAYVDVLANDPMYKNVTQREAQVVYNLFQRIIQAISVQLPKVDIIHTSLAWFPALAAIPNKLMNHSPLMVTEHGVAFSLLSLYTSSYLFNQHSSIIWKFFCGNVIKCIYSAADKVYPVCKANMGWESYLGLIPSKIKIIYNGVDTSAFYPFEVKRETERPTVVYVGRIDIFKDIITLIDAVKYSKTDVPNVNCLIYGSCSDEDYAKVLINKVNNLGLADNIKFMGKTTKAAEAYNGGDLVVLTSLTEGFPFSIIEAMACGKPIVATDVGGVREALEGCGLLVKSRHPREFSEAMVSILTDSQLRLKLSNNALERARAIFSKKDIIKRYDEEYEDILKNQNIVDHVIEAKNTRFSLSQKVQRN